MRRGGTSRAIALVAVAVAALAGCGVKAVPSATEQAPGYLAKSDHGGGDHGHSGSVTVDLDYDTGEATGLDPAPARVARSWTILGLTYETLVGVGPDLAVRPELATSWTQPDPTTYVFTIRQGVSFSNGSPLTADDVTASLQRLLTSKGVWAGQLGPVASVQTTGADQVTVKLSAPYTPFLAALANTPAAILPMADIAAGRVDPKTQMVGTGPYVPKAHRQDVSWTFAVNPRYRDASSLSIRELRLKIVPQESTRAAALRDGSAQMTALNSIDSVALLGGTKQARVVNQQASDFYYLILNSRRPGSPLADQQTRFALNSLIDRKQVADIALAGQVRPTGAAPVTLPGGCSTSSLPSQQVATSAAKKALTKLRGTTLGLLVYTSEPAVTQIAQLIQQQLSDAGVKTTITRVDDATYNDRVFVKTPGRFDLTIGWYAGYADPAMVTRWWNPKVAGFSAGFLADHADLDQLITQAGAQSPGQQRDQTLAQLCDTADRYSEMVPLVTRPLLTGYRTDRLAPTIPTKEGYGDPLRDIADFEVIGR